MCSLNPTGRWQLCPGCGRERRLAAGRAVMCDHNRWDSIAWAMVPCEGSGQEPRSSGHAGTSDDPVPAVQGKPEPGGSRAA
jgi:hypothetical protein